MLHHPVATAIGTAIAGRDPQRLSAALTETVRLRALLPGGPVESCGRADVVARFRSWFADFDAVQLLDSAGEPVSDRLLIHYRLGLSTAETRWICTQTAVCKVVDERLAVIDLVCSGFREVDDDEHVTAPSRARLVG